ncbi:MAG: hypothetical protein LBT37_05810 [Lactobacillaceae bacterium]|jgi:hypothetical protein|nr:hypothetical protein [Lactobacillaceae bacterium]
MLDNKLKKAQMRYYKAETKALKRNATMTKLAELCVLVFGLYTAHNKKKEND